MPGWPISVCRIASSLPLATTGRNTPTELTVRVRASIMPTATMDLPVRPSGAAT